MLINNYYNNYLGYNKNKYKKLYKVRFFIFFKKKVPKK